MSERCDRCEFKRITEMSWRCVRCGYTHTIKGRDRESEG